MEYYNYQNFWFCLLGHKLTVLKYENKYAIEIKYQYLSPFELIILKPTFGKEITKQVFDKQMAMAIKHFFPSKETLMEDVSILIDSALEIFACGFDFTPKYEETYEMFRNGGGAVIFNSKKEVVSTRYRDFEHLSTQDEVHIMFTEFGCSLSKQGVIISID